MSRALAAIALRYEEACTRLTKVFAWDRTAVREVAAHAHATAAKTGIDCGELIDEVFGLGLTRTRYTPNEAHAFLDRVASPEVGALAAQARTTRLEAFRALDAITRQLAREEADRG